jgi:glycosyltransferase involved in cell wall biosynthesis
VRVTICICTFKRRELLANLLSGVAELTFSKTAEPEISVVVVDNDAARSAEEICAAASQRWPIKYAVEPRRNMASVRNRAVLEAGDVDFVALLDDDEVPTPQWLDELLATQSQFEADVVSGPVTPVFSAETPEWMRTGGFFDRPRFATGHEMDKCSTNNVLVRREVFARARHFEEGMQLTGVEDTHFFMRVKQAGYKIVWCDEALVHETIPAARANLRWLLARGYRLGNTWVLCELSLDRRWRTRAMRAVKACAWVARGLATVATAPFTGKAGAVRGLRTALYGVGEITALAGQKYQEYKSAGMDPVDRPAASADVSAS